MVGCQILNTEETPNCLNADIWLEFCFGNLHIPENFQNTSYKKVPLNHGN